MRKRIIDIRDCAGDIIRAMRPGILITTKVGDKVNSMTIGWGTLGVIGRELCSWHTCAISVILVKCSTGAVSSPSMSRSAIFHERH